MFVKRGIFVAQICGKTKTVETTQQEVYNPTTYIATYRITDVSYAKLHVTYLFEIHPYTTMDESRTKTSTHLKKIIIHVTYV